MIKSESIKSKLAINDVIDCAQQHENPTDIYLNVDCDQCDKYKYTLCCCFKSSLLLIQKLKLKSNK